MFVIKVGDFGLSRAMGSNKAYYYMKASSNNAIPLRWTAPEAIARNRWVDLRQLD